MRLFIWISIVLLLILHQDNWNWKDETLVLGFLPIGLAWHMGISICASIAWYLATIFAWPEHLEYVGEENEQ